MKKSKILESMSRYIYPFIIMYGFYVTLHGDITPGGGFQGGAIIATGILLVTFFSEMEFDLMKLNKIEKLIFLFIIGFSSISFFVVGVPFTSFVKGNNRIFLVILNLLIGLKVTIGLVNILLSFLEEGDQFK